jgi:hypothetical protein
MRVVTEKRTLLRIKHAQQAHTPPPELLPFLDALAELIAQQILQGSSRTSEVHLASSPPFAKEGLGERLSGLSDRNVGRACDELAHFYL